MLNSVHSLQKANAKSVTQQSYINFQSTQPMRAATLRQMAICAYALFQSTLPMRAATKFLFPSGSVGDISIHAVQVDSDINFFIKNSLFTISIRAAHDGCDQMQSMKCSALLVFQSTLPVWAATGEVKSRDISAYISIHAAHAGCDNFIPTHADADGISIHAAHEGCDATTFVLSPPQFISIHAARVGSDRCLVCNQTSCFHFNPRCPCGQRH